MTITCPGLLHTLSPDPTQTLMNQEIGVLHRMNSPVVSTYLDTKSIAFQRSDGYNIIIYMYIHVINPRRACAARITVVSCVCVCVSYQELGWQSLTKVCNQTIDCSVSY